MTNTHDNQRIWVDKFRGRSEADHHHSHHYIRGRSEEGFRKYLSSDGSRMYQRFCSWQ